MVVVESRHGLDLLKVRSAVYFVVEVNVNDVLELMDDIEEMSVLGELEMPGSGFQLGVKDRALLDVAVLPVQCIYIDMIHSEIGGQEETVVSRHLHALHVRPEIALRDTSQSLEEELVTDLSHRAVLTEPEHGDLSVVIAGDKEKFSALAAEPVAW